MSFKRLFARTEMLTNCAGPVGSVPDSAMPPHVGQELRTDILSMAEISFAHPFTLPGFNGQLPPGRYEFEIEVDVWRAYTAPKSWKEYILIHLHNPMPSPGMPRTLNVRLVDLESALACDALRGPTAESAFLDGMLADPLVRLLMEADRVSEAELRQLSTGMPVEAEVGQAMQCSPISAKRRPPDGVLQAGEHLG